MNILVIRFTALGDLISLEPVFRSFRYFYKYAKIDFLTSAIGKGLYEDSSYFDAFIVEKSLTEQIMQVRKKHYDVIFNLQCTRPSHIATLLAKKDRLIDKSYTILQKFLNFKADEYDMEKMLIKSGVDQDSFDNYKNIQNVFKIQMPYTKNSEIKKLLYDKFKCKKLIAIAPGASKRWLSKKWGKENFSNLVGLLQDKYGIVLIGSSLEIEDAKYIANKFNNVLDMTNKTSLTQLKSWLSYMDLFIGNDSGPTHLAAALRVSTITIFGSTSTIHCPKLIFKDKPHFCIKPSKKIECHPCYKSKCPTQHECMKDIKPKQICSIIENYFKEKNECF